MSETNKARLARIRADAEAFGWAQAGVFGPPEGDDLQWLLDQAEGRAKAERNLLASRDTVDVLARSEADLRRELDEVRDKALLWGGMVQEVQGAARKIEAERDDLRREFSAVVRVLKTIEYVGMGELGSGTPTCPAGGSRGQTG